MWLIVLGQVGMEDEQTAASPLVSTETQASYWGSWVRRRVTLGRLPVEIDPAEVVKDDLNRSIMDLCMLWRDVHGVKLDSTSIHIV